MAKTRRIVSGAVVGLLGLLSGVGMTSAQQRDELANRKAAQAQEKQAQEKDEPTTPTDEEPLDEQAIQQLTQRIEKALGQSLEEPDVARRLIADLPQPAPGPVMAALREHDRAGKYKADGAGRALRREVYLALGRTGDFRSLHYLYEAFEAQPARRQDVAEALAVYAAKHGRRVDEWQIMVRALPILEPSASHNVLASLLTFPRRGSKPKWQREVILAGLRMAPADREVAVKLMEHWTGRKQPPGEVKITSDSTPAERLDAWRVWFDMSHSDMPPARLAVDPPMAKHKYADLLERVRSGMAKGDAARGSQVFDKALCVKCHRMGQRGEAMGPDLTSTPHKYQEGEMLEALLFPSQSIAEDYGAVAVETKSGRVFTGIVNASAAGVVVLQANGEKAMMTREDIQRTSPVVKSAMPEGLLDTLTPDEIVDLFAFLFHRELR